MKPKYVFDATMPHHYDYLVDANYEGDEGAVFSSREHRIFQVFSTIQGAVNASTSWRYAPRFHRWELPLPRWILRLVARILKRPRTFVAPGTYRK